MAKQAGRGNAGNSMQDALDFQASMARVGIALGRFERVCDDLADQGIYVRGLRVRLPNGDQGDYLVVVTANAEGRPVVAFNNGYSLGEALLSTVKRLETGDVVWRDDKYSNG